MRLLVIVLFLSAGAWLNARSAYSDARLRAIADSIVAEADTLYLLEWGAWRSSDKLMERKNIIPGRDMTGYLTYVDNGLSHTIFYYEMETSVNVVADYVWTLKSEIPERVLEEVRGMTDYEMKLFRIKNAVRSYIAANPKLVDYPPGCTLNMAILPGDTSSRVFLLPGVTESRLIPLGNDYKIVVDSAYHVADFKKIHESYIPLQTDYGKAGKAVVSMHSHPDALPFITSTDICMLRLYGPLYGMEKHLVLSEYPAVFDIKTNMLQFVSEDGMRAFFEK